MNYNSTKIKNLKWLKVRIAFNGISVTKLLDITYCMGSLITECHPLHAPHLNPSP